MSNPARYQVAGALQMICDGLSIDPRILLKKSGLPPDFLAIGNVPVSGKTFFDLWDALADEADPKDLPALLAAGACDGGVDPAKAGFDSAAYAFSSSPTVRVGLERKATFKPLHLPIRVTLSEDQSEFSITFQSVVLGRELPVLIGWFDLAYFVMAIRNATGVHVVPQAIVAPQDWPGWADRAAFFGTDIQTGPDFKIVLRKQDVELPLISRNDALWAEIEASLRARLAKMPDVQPMSARVREALIGALPAGDATAEAIGKRLGLSKRSLQRRLGEEGESFKSILEQTRRALALTYLQGTEMSVQEIAFLLGFRDASSFFRAFRAWTGKTPLAVRQSQSQSA